MRIRVTGRVPLTGTYTPAGSANAAQALLAAALLADQPVTLHNVPDTRSTQALISQMVGLGAELTQADTSCTVSGAGIVRRALIQSEMDATLGVILLVAPLLVRRRHVRLEIDFPLNRIRPHLEALRDLGIDVTAREGAVEFTGGSWDRRDLVLTQTSVTATALVLMLAARLGKETVIYNAACEPHIGVLADLLNAMGARITGMGSNVLRVYGTDELNGAEITLPFDHIEAASIAALAAMTGGRVTIAGCRSIDLRLIGKVYRGLGITFDLEDAALHVPRHDALMISNREEDRDAAVETAPWPGFPSDLVAVATVIATQARGTSLIHEKLYNNRLLFVDKLKAMGAQIVLCDPHRAIVVGAAPLRGIYMDSPDVRTGLGMLAAALVADGSSVIDNAGALEQTFAGVISKLKTLNAQIVNE